MPTLSSSNRSQLIYKPEVTFGVTPAGNGVKLNMTSESLDFSIKNESSKVIRDDRQVSDLVQVGASAQGGFGFEHQYKEFDPFIQALIGNAYTYYGTSGISSAFAGALTLGATSITNATAPTGNDAFTNLKKGQWFTLVPPVAASAAVKAYFKRYPLRVSLTTPPTTTVITLETATSINTTEVGTAMAVGAQICSATAGSAGSASVQTSFTLQVSHSDISSHRVYRGMVPSKMDLAMKVNSIVSGNFEFMGKDMILTAAANGVMNTSVAAQTFTPANATKGVFDIIEGTGLISAGTFIKMADISIDNSLRIQDAIGVFGAAGIAPGTQQIRGKLSVYFADTVMYAKMIAGEASALHIPVLDVDGNGYVYSFPRIKYTAAKVNAGGLDQDNELQMDFQALPDVTVGSDTLGKSCVITRVGTVV